MTESDNSKFPPAQIWDDGELATEKEVRELLESIGKQAHEHGLADFAVDQMYEDARVEFQRYVNEGGGNG